MTEAGDSSVISSKEIFDMLNLSVRSNEGGERFGRIINWKRIE